MDVRQRADDALEALASFRDGALADLQHELGRAEHDALGFVEGFEKDPLHELTAVLHSLANGGAWQDVISKPEPAPAAPAAAGLQPPASPPKPPAPSVPAPAPAREA